MGYCYGKKDHQLQRMQLNQWDDVTRCTVCGHWAQVHANARGKNPNFEQQPKGKRIGGDR